LADACFNAHCQVDWTNVGGDPCLLKTEVSLHRQHSK